MARVRTIRALHRLRSVPTYRAGQSVQLAAGSMATLGLSGLIAGNAPALWSGRRGFRGACPWGWSARQAMFLVCVSDQARRLDLGKGLGKDSSKAEAGRKPHARIETNVTVRGARTI